MSRPESWSRSAGASPVWAIAGEPSSGPRGSSSRGGELSGHVRTVWVGTGETRLPNLVSKDRLYKPMVKTDGGKRESDGVVVPLIAGMNPAGWKDPDFGHADNGPEILLFRPLRMATTGPLAREEPEAATSERGGGLLDRGLAPWPGPACDHEHYPIPEGSVTMS